MKPRRRQGSFILSLDLEMAWGVVDVTNEKDITRENLDSLQLLRSILSLCDSYKVKTTVAVVGALLDPEFDIEDWPNTPKLCMVRNLLVKRPDLIEIFNRPELLEVIMSTGNHELASHTYFHTNFLDEGGFDINKLDFAKFSDLNLRLKSEVESIVFPRNQYNADLLQLCLLHGFKYFRGNQNRFWYRTRSSNRQIPLIKSLRLADSFVPFAGFGTFEVATSALTNVPASLFFRQFSGFKACINPIVLLRIKAGMFVAALTGRNFQLWWHPHNFCLNSVDSLVRLERILSFYMFLKKRFNFNSKMIREL